MTAYEENNLRRFLTILLSLATLAIAGDGYAQNAIISIDNVTHASGTDLLRTGNVHQVSIRYNCLGLSSERLWSAANAFEIYSPDGADWGYLQAATGPLVAAAGPVMVYMKHFNFDGSTWTQTGNNGVDPAGGSTGAYSRAAFYLATISIMGTEGYEGGVDNDIAATFEFMTDPADADQGLHICIDTAQTLVNGGFWEWAGGNNSDFPVWDNGLGASAPRCWELVHDHCCEGLVGNANGLGDDAPTLGDIAVIVDAIFRTGSCTGLIDCLAEADVDQSGGFDPTCDDLTIADVSILIDYLYITGPGLSLPQCLM